MSFNRELWDLLSSPQWKLLAEALMNTSRDQEEMTKQPHVPCAFDHQVFNRMDSLPWLVPVCKSDFCDSLGINLYSDVYVCLRPTCVSPQCVSCDGLAACCVCIPASC